ncbi:GNAT family N-acetyltransferase [Aliivibrio finisterrensis]|uniref:GNAT family N-acetyltransferase n=1 Tax=Aliivibrio finisterrensis TaxID=511998 RepID=UPI00101EE5BC|nr:GNAT family N-acetyltransferase [Aliivibrio finisterrensis]RYU71277.1 GNAT family N-acetyltransferase [Aliivibrio finisterrensis]RYU75005.1 GNAT family N-acetyltransferase [Aliivibrio finisterrensis]RYU77450.1 GNAT family N-acetyltransferase [Aliivibrio finisterrensis]
MFEVKNVNYTGENEQAIREVRDTVFIQEQSIDPDIEFDGLDESAVHAIVYSNAQPVGTGRILDDGHIGRIAILKAFRGQGLGSKIVLSLIDEATKRGYPRVYLGSQKHAINFYTKLGFQPYGDEFMEAGIPHLSMEKLLNK